jgi:uncharacterized repeat protein (TIGR01451 family)
MGGVLSRIWTHDFRYRWHENYGEGNINRLVTIDSPHHGCWLTDFAQVLKLSPLSYELVALIMSGIDMPIKNGAVDDLSSISEAIKQMNSDRTEVAVHAVVGDYEFSFNPNCIPPLIPDPLLIALQEIDCLVGSGAPLPLHSDLIVSAESQAGGLEFPQASTYSHFHNGAANQSNVITRGIILLRSSPASSKYEHDFPTWIPPLTLPASLPAPLALAKNQPANLSSGDGLIISTPTNDAAVVSGGTLAVTVTPTGSFVPTRLLLVTRGWAEVITNAALTFVVPIATNAIGPQSIVVIATDAARNVVSAGVTVRVAPSSGLNALVVDPSFFFLSLPGEQRQLAVRGVFSDGVERTLTPANVGTSYFSANTNVATVDRNGVVTARGDGYASIMVSNANALGFASTSVELVSAANIAISQITLPSQPYQGQPQTLSLLITNHGPDTANSVVLSAILPPNTTVSAISASQGVCTITNGRLFCVLGVLTNGSTASVALELAYALAGTVTHSFVATLAGWDSDPHDNTASGKVTVAALPRLQIRRDGKTLVLTVVHPGTGFVLEETASLSPPAVWTAVTPLPPNAPDPCELTIPTPAGPRLYRLNRSGN